MGHVGAHIECPAMATQAFRPVDSMDQLDYLSLKLLCCRSPTLQDDLVRRLINIIYD